jgi:hypothetical protein
MPATWIEVPLCSAEFKSVRLAYSVLVKKQFFVFHSRTGADKLSKRA